MRYKGQFALLFTLAMLLSITGLNAQSWGKGGVRGEGPTVERELSVKNFKGIKVTTAGKIYLERGDRFSVKAVGQANILDLINQEVSGDGVWKINFRENVRSYDKLAIYITMPHLELLHLSGSANVESRGTFTGIDEFSLRISGSGNIYLSLEANRLEGVITGSGNINLRGNVQEHYAKITGSGNYKAYDLQAKRCEARITGSGRSEVNVSDQLMAQISGSGSIYYKGDPSVRSKISGSGNVKNRG